MTSVEAQARRPDELLSSEVDRALAVGSFARFVVAAVCCDDRLRRCGDALVRGWCVRGEPFQVDRGAAEQELDVEGGSAAAADAAEAVLVLQLGDHALGVGHPSLVRPDTGVAFRACPSLEREPLRVRARLATVARQHRLLRRDVRDDPSFGGRLPDALGREALVGADTRELRQREADTVEQRRERVALMTLGALAEAARDTTLLRIDADLAAVDEVRTLARLSLQPRVWIGRRDSGRVRRFPFRRRPRTRLGQPQLRRPAGAGVFGSRLVLPVTGDRFQAGAQTAQGRVRLGVETVDRKVAALDQPLLLAQRDRVQEQPLEHLAVGETLRLRLRDRLMRGQPLAQAVTEEETQIETQIRDPQQLAHRTDPLQRTRQHQLQQHRRIDRRPADALDVIGPSRRTHKTPLADDLIDPPVTIVRGHQLVQADHRDLPRPLLRPRLTHRHRQPSLARQNLYLERRTPTGPQTPTFRTRP